MTAFPVHLMPRFHPALHRDCCCIHLCAGLPNFAWPHRAKGSVLESTAAWLLLPAMEDCGKCSPRLRRCILCMSMAAQRAALEDALRQLYILGAIDMDGHISELGRRMAALPVEPSVARTLIAAAELHCLPDALTVAAMLSAETIFLGNRRARFLIWHSTRMGLAYHYICVTCSCCPLYMPSGRACLPLHCFSCSGG